MKLRGIRMHIIINGNASAVQCRWTVGVYNSLIIVVQQQQHQETFYDGFNRRLVGWLNEA